VSVLDEAATTPAARKWGAGALPGPAAAAAQAVTRQQDRQPSASTEFGGGSVAGHLRTVSRDTAVERVTGIEPAQ
jgi:hypothetical protein